MSHVFNLEIMIQILNLDMNQEIQTQNLGTDSAFPIQMAESMVLFQPSVDILPH